MFPLLRPCVFAAVAIALPVVPASNALSAERVDPAGARISNIVRARDAVFFLERRGGAGAARLMVRAGAARPRLVLDPETLRAPRGESPRLAISRVLPAPDASRVAVGLVAGGVETATQLRIVETATGRILPDDFPRAWPGATAWSLDGTTLFYAGLAPAAADREPVLEQRSTVFRHLVGTTGPDPAVFGIGVDPNVPLVPTDRPALTIPIGSNYALGIVAHGREPELTLYAAPIAAVLAGRQIPWRQVADVADAVTAIDVHGNTAYLLTHRDAPRSRVTALDLSDDAATAAGAPTVVAMGSGRIVGLAVASDALYVRGEAGGQVDLRRFPWGAESDGSADGAGPAGTGRAPVGVEIAIPAGETIAEFAVDARVDGAILALASATQPVRIVTLDAQGRLSEPGPPALTPRGR